MPFDLDQAVADLALASSKAARRGPLLQVARVEILVAYRAHLLRLSAGALRARFGILPCRASLDACARPAPNRQMMLLWRDRTVCGAVELHLIRPELAELVMSLDDALHGLELGQRVELCGARITLGDDEVSTSIDVWPALERWQTNPAHPPVRLPDDEVDLCRTPTAVIASAPAVRPASVSS